MGRKPVDRNLKIASGTLRTGRDNVAAPTATSGEFPNPFTETCHAYRIWERQYEELRQRGCLSESYADMLEAYCDACQRLREAREMLDEHGVVIKTDRGLVKNPAMTVLTEAVRIIRSVGSEFGLSPSSIQGTYSQSRVRKSLVEFANSKSS